MEYLIDPEALIQISLADTHQPLIFDCRFNLMDADAGFAAYQEGHIPGAIYADLNRQLSSPVIPEKTGRHPLPDKNTWIAQVQQWGITPQHKVVVYDDMACVMAARMWWLLRWIGHDNVVALNGGWQAWLQAGGETEQEIPAAKPVSDFDYASLPAISQSIDIAGLDASKQLLLDAREEPRFLGEVEPIDPVAGHIPGATCSPTSANLNDDKTFKSPDELREKFTSATSTDQKRVVCYCGSGVSAAHNILAMRIAGLKEPELYAGSWSEWIIDPDRPIATGHE